MSINLKQYKDKLLFVPLGGTNEIGINVNLYHYQGKWIMIDCGSGFAADLDLPGVDMVVADLTFIEEHKHNLLGLVLTHAHEDHLGAIQYLWNGLECPIYATKFTKCFLQAKLLDYSFSKKIDIIEVKPFKPFDLGPFSIEMLGLTHSAPEMQALAIRTPEGTVVHTGDWKFDPNPLIGPVSSIDHLKKLGDEGVLALACDSTNVFNSGTSGSEGDVRDSLVEIISKCPKMVIVTTFASNLARLDSLIYAGRKTGRKICLVGRSIHRIVAAAREAGYLQETDSIIDEKSVGKYKREDLLIIATGCQGEEMAATSKIANDIHNTISIAPRDTVIFSSKIIPGNEKKIFQLFNQFVKKKAEVITERDHFVHVSGHPAIEELKHMYELVRPQICIPVHGEPIHIHEQAKLARANGIPQAIEVENGSVVLLSKEESKIIGKVHNGYLGVDGNYLLPNDSSIFKLRRRMRSDGIVISTIIVDKKFQLICDPIIDTPGLFDFNADAELINEFKTALAKEYDGMRSKIKADISKDKIESFAKKILKRLVKDEVNKSPVILINIKQIDK